jgi:hypothetical protein
MRSVVDLKVVMRHMSAHLVGKPRAIWTNVVRRDTSQLIGILGGRVLAENREEASCEGGQCQEVAVAP